MDDIYKNIEECNPNKERKILIVFDETFLSFLSRNHILKYQKTEHYTLLFYENFK